ncbi:hypothetical protein FGO68_gene14164 [Halteria grandinella]|uniref:RING-type domain-containing protein n=1 Tax=Halteria grandinella TaxID=5974 RepID=A0A8J8T4S7_HALGN|nr:hypothetical protein FGO68_gene14164 [Halteria grandinella]
MDEVTNSEEASISQVDGKTDQIKHEEKKKGAGEIECVTGLPFFDYQIQTGCRLPPKDMKELLKRQGCECTLCLQQFRSGQEVKIISKCRHVFHRQCIDKWLRVKAQCPIDRLKA